MVAVAVGVGVAVVRVVGVGVLGGNPVAIGAGIVGDDAVFADDARDGIVAGIAL